MKLVMTLLARDEADVVDAQLAFHLHAGVDFVVATDHGSSDGTTEILERYARAGYLHLIREQDPEYREVEWRTRMARLGATEFGADWVINSDADEFWWPRGENLKAMLASIPPRYGIVRAFWRPFVPRPDDDRLFAERMTVRLSPDAAIHDPTSQFRPNAKVIHRAHPRLTVGRGNHTIDGVSLQPLRGWYPVELFHFPMRSLAQVERKASIYRSSDETRLHDGHRKLHVALEAGNLEDQYREHVVDDRALERGLAEGSLVDDTRLRDALRMLVRTDEGAYALPENGRDLLRLPLPTVVDDAAYAADAAVLGEADTVRLQRRLDELEARLATLEWSPGRRLGRKAGSIARSIRRSPDSR